MVKVIEMLDPIEGEEGQWLGVYITRWRPEWGAPTAMFREVDVTEIPEVGKLMSLCRKILDGCLPKFHLYAMEEDNYREIERALEALEGR